MLNGSFFAVRKLNFHLCLFLADARVFAAFLARARGCCLAGTGLFSTDAARAGRRAGTGCAPTSVTGFRVKRFAVPFGVVEVFVGFYEVVDREVVFAVVEPGTSADDLFELDHRSYGP